MNHNRARHTIFVCLAIQFLAVVFLFLNVFLFPNHAPANAPYIMATIFGLALAVIVILLSSLYDKN